jgi:hypothetical protein
MESPELRLRLGLSTAARTVLPTPTVAKTMAATSAIIEPEPVPISEEKYNSASNWSSQPPGSTESRNGNFGREVDRWRPGKQAVRLPRGPPQLDHADHHRSDDDA